MADVEDILARMRLNPQNMRFADVCKVCNHYFGPPRQQGTSHRIYRMPWQGDPRVNIQSDRGRAKGYQVRQVIAAIERLRRERAEEA